MPGPGKGSRYSQIMAQFPSAERKCGLLTGGFPVQISGAYGALSAVGFNQC